MANKNIFCNSPWYECHIYWDGSLGICCQESRKIHSDSTKYNIKNMSLHEWFNSLPVRNFRKNLLSDTTTDICNLCYDEEAANGTSRRHRSNHKSVIFTKLAFDDSFQQSPGYKHFKLSKDADGITDTLPIDFHIDLGNYCNLACKMCYTGASSKIAVQMVKWGHEEHRQFVNTDWTKDTVVWQKFLQELVTIPKLKNIHVMGGETLLSNRFHELVDFMLANNRTDVSFSFVTNGTKFDAELIDKLKNFPRVGIEISIETLTKHNDYIRQGNDLNQVLVNTKKFIEVSNGSSVTVTIRPTLTSLSIGQYHTLLRYCLNEKLLIKSLLVSERSYLEVSVLPDAIKQSYVGPYKDLIEELSDISTANEINESDPNNYKISIKLAAIQALNLLNTRTDFNPTIFKLFVDNCKKWDIEYKLNALELYPELQELLIEYGY